MSDAVTIKLFLPKGDAKSIRIAEISNWSGKGIAAPRNELQDFLLRPELEQAGVYILLGVDPEDGEPLAYVGEAEILKERLRNHHANKDFWNQVVAFISKDENLTKAHVRYLESLLITEATEIGRVKLDNSQTSKARLPESDIYEMAAFLGKIKQLLPVLGSDLLLPITEKQGATNDNNVLIYKNKGHIATGNRTNSGFVVYKGSEAVVDMRPAGKDKSWLVKRRDLLKSKGVIVLKNNKFVFTKDEEFSSPSTAAALICGGSANGLIVWKDKGGKTLKELES